VAHGLGGDRKAVLGQAVLTEGGDLDHEVEPVEERGGDSLCEVREHVFVKVRRCADGRPRILQEALQIRLLAQADRA
jgi:hypothetical protein